jgi:ABC-type thiamin/hydroxymethylpyrimidine transport system permease subunit
MKKPSYFTTRDLIVMAILVAVTGLFQTFWAHLVFNAGALGPFSNMFTAFGFNIATFLVLYLIPKPGAATIVKSFAAVIELALGNPVGPVVLFYGFAEGLAADLAFIMFKRNLTLMMVIVGSLMAWIFTAPVDVYRDAVPLNIDALTAYFGPGGAGKVWTSFWVYLAIMGFAKAGLKPVKEPETEAL